MGIPRFFKTREPNRFNYKPLYWDPDKEKREERVRRIKAELGQEVELGKRPSSTITRGSFRQYSSRSNRKAGRESNLRIILIVALLLLIAYLFFYR